MIDDNTARTRAAGAVGISRTDIAEPSEADVFMEYDRIMAEAAGDPNNPIRIKDDATVDELRAEIMLRISELVSAGILDLEALPLPEGLATLINKPTFWSDR